MVCQTLDRWKTDDGWQRLPWWMCSLLWIARSLLCWSYLSQVWCCYDNAKSEMFASLDSHWGLSWGVHGAVPKRENMGTHGETYHLHFMLTVWRFTSRIPWNWPQRQKPDHPWASRTPSLIILTSPGCSCEAGYVYYVQCKFEVSVLFSYCPSAAWLFDGIFDGLAEFSKTVILICNTFSSMCMAWFGIWDASSSFFETLDARLIVLVADGLWYGQSFLLYHDGPFNLPGKPTR